MAKTLDIRPQVTNIVMSVRFERGYRFLDSCGEAVVQLEDTLEEGWIPGDLAPTGGVMRNYALGLQTKFDAQQVNVTQSEFISFDIFADQTAKIYETLWRLFRVDDVLSPALRVDIQIGFPDIEAAEKYAQSLGYLAVTDKVAEHLGGEISALNYVVCTENPIRRFDHDLTLRRRLAVRAHTQTKQPDFDARIMQRVNLLPERHRNAIKPLLKLRSEHVASIENRTEISFEETLEGKIETRSFAIREFLDAAWKHSQTLIPHYKKKLEFS